MNLGCFWGLQLAFQRVPGVVSSEVGYTQGHVRNPVGISTNFFIPCRVTKKFVAEPLDMLKQYAWNLILI